MLPKSIKQNETLAVLCVQGALTMAGTGIISPVLPLYARSFGVSITMVGLLITTFGVARIITDIPAGRLTEKLGRRPVVIAGPVILCVSSIACGLATNYWELLAFRFVQGLGSALYTTAAMIMLADKSTPENRGRVMGLFQGSNLAGNGLGPIIGGFAAQYLGMQAPFFIFAFLAALAALWSYFRIPETRTTLSSSPEHANNSNPHSKHSASGIGLRSVLRNLNFTLIATVTFGIFFMRNGARNQTLPLFASERLGATAGQIGVGLTVIAIIDLITLFMSGRLSDRFGRKAVIVPGGIVSAASLIMLALTQNYWFLLVTCAVWGAGAGISGPTPAAYIADITPRKNYSSAMSLYRTVGDFGFVIGPILMGWLTDVRGFSFALLFNAIFLLVSVSLFQLLAKEPSRIRGKAVTT